MSCETLNQQSIFLNVSFGSLPEGFCPASMQDLGAAIAARLIISSNQSFSSFAVGSLEPTSNVGPWLKDCLEWFVFDDATARYVPIKSSAIAGNLTGMITMWSGTVANKPAGYLVCDGNEYNRIEYPELFAVIGTQYGSSSAFSFKVPDMRNTFPVGADSDNAGRAETNVSDGVTYTKSRVYTPHTHTGSITTNAQDNTDGADPGSANNQTYPFTTSVETPRAIPPYLALVFIIKT